MPGGSKKAADAALIVQLAAGISPAGAAQFAGVSEATAYRRLASPAFRQRVEKARADFWERALGVMSKGAAESAIVLRRLLRSDDGRLKLQAAKALLETGMKIREVVGLSQQIEELQTEIERLKRERGTGNGWDCSGLAASLADIGAMADGMGRRDAELPMDEPPSGDKAEDDVKPLFDPDGDIDSDVKPLFDS